MIAYIIAVAEKKPRRFHITKVLTLAPNPEQAIENVKGHYKVGVRGWDQNATFEVAATLNPGETRFI